MLIQLVISGIVSGSLYALVALGLVMIYKGTEVVNFAQGELVMVGAYVGLSFQTLFHCSYFITFIFTLAFGIIFGMLLELIVCRPLVKAPIISIVIATLALSNIFKGAVHVIWGTHYYPFPPAFSTEPINVGIISVTPQNIWITFFAVMIMIILFCFFKYTKVGNAMRATSLNQTAAFLMGIKVFRMFSLIWAISAAVGAAAGILMAPLISLDPNMGIIIIKAFAAAILGGFDSLPGAVLGGFLLGIIENLVGGYITSEYRDAIAFVILIGVLIVKPTGLFGTSAVKRV